MKGKCEDCKWFEREAYMFYFDTVDIKEMIAKGIAIEDRQRECDEECCYGFCHRYPPSVDKKLEALTQIKVFVDSWCGEFEAKTTTKPLKRDASGRTPREVALAEIEDERQRKP